MVCFYYFHPDEALSSPDLVEKVAEFVRLYDIGLVVLDSLTIASRGADASSQADISPIMADLERWGTVLAIDHLSRAAARGNASKAWAFGTVFKRNHARSAFNLTRTTAGGLLLVPNKANFAPPPDPICYTMDFQEEQILFRQVQAHAEEMAGVLVDLPTHEVTLLAIRECVAEHAPLGATVEDVYAWRSEHGVQVERGTIKNHLTALKVKQKIRYSDGRALPMAPADALTPILSDNGHFPP